MVDLAIVGAGPAGAAAAIGALREDPLLDVVLLDRTDFPRDKACGDGIAPHVLDLLADAGVTGLVDDQVPVPRLRLQRGAQAVDRTMARPAWVVPRAVFDERLVRAAVQAGASLNCRRVRSVTQSTDRVILDGVLEARSVVGADGAHSVVRRAVGKQQGPGAIAMRGYAPTPPGRAGVQEIAFGTGRQPAYAWSFDRGDGLANVGYGELLGGRLTRANMLARLEALLPGATAGGRDWKGHLLPLSTWKPLRPARGRVLLAGDAAGLVNPMTGEGIFYAVATGLLAGRAAAVALARGEGHTAGEHYVSAVRGLLGGHLRHTALAAALCRSGTVLDAGLRASANDQRVFDDLVELGLARGRITGGVLSGLLRHLTDRSAAAAPDPLSRSTRCAS